MKKFFCYLMCVLFVLSSVVTSFASEIEENSSADLEPVPNETVPNEPDLIEPVLNDPSNSSDNPSDVYLNMVLNNMQTDIDNLQSEVSTIKDDVSTLSQSSSVSDTPTEDVAPSEENPALGPTGEEPVVTGVSIYSVSPVTPSDTNGLKAVLLGLIGNYDAIVVEYEYRNPNNSYNSYLREIQPDYVWIASFCMLALVVYCVFRLGGALIG